MSPDRAAAPTVADLHRFVNDNNISTFRVGALDCDGLWRGKHIAASHFLETVATRGTNLCNVVFGWDMQDVPIDGLDYTGWQTGFPDLVLLPDLSTLRSVPWEPGTASVICDVQSRNGTLLPLAPRTVLKRVVEQVQAAGYEPLVGYELEFYLLKSRSDGSSGPTFAGLEPVSGGNHTYSLHRNPTAERVLRDIRQCAAQYGVEIEGSNSEHGPGQFEINLRHSGALQAADDAARLKHLVKESAARHGLTASFIAKLAPDWAGSSGHCHQSLLDSEREPVFANPADASRLSACGESYLSGVLELASEFSALYLPTINSYKRVRGGLWAGSSATWGYDNRTVGVRAIPSAGPDARIENRIAGADANPYLAIGANLAAGLHGIEKGLRPPTALVGNGYEQTERMSGLPKTLLAATEAFAASGTARALFGEAFVDHYAATRRWEVERFDSAVTDWEIARYLEPT